jgi:mycobactin peptide synthetase MbtE
VDQVQAAAPAVPGTVNARGTSGRQRLIALIRSHADRAGGSIAIQESSRAITYAEVGRLVDERVEVLRAHGGSGAFVALERARSADFVLDYLAVLSVGGIAVPIDPQTPPERRVTFLDLVRPDLRWTPAGLDRLPGAPMARDVHPDGAFVYFTSGSTGRPKPVLGSASAVCRFVIWFGLEFGISGHDRFAFGSGVSFEASLRDIFPPLANGATLVVPDDDTGGPEAVVDWMARYGVTVVTAVPSVARGWLRHARSRCPAVRAAFFLGEPLTGDVVDRWHTVFPSTGVLVNSYGSTESGQGTIIKRIPPGVRFDRVPAGRPVPDTRYCLIDPAAALDAALVRTALAVPADGTGEVVIVSSLCSHGYLGMPGENRDRFVDLGDGLTAYRTGDLGRVDPDGDLVVIGRTDDEVKINGVRVHPAEVTRALRERPAVADAFVVATPATGADAATPRGPRLTAYVVPAGPLDVAALRRQLMDTLPLAMLPARFVVLDALPTGRTGKVDRAALTRLADRPDPVQDVPPTGELECWVADRFTELFGLARVSALDDFLALGGDSIMATRLAAWAERDLGLELTHGMVFAGATVTGIATAILEQQLRATDPAELQALLDALDDQSDAA